MILFWVAALTKKGSPAHRRAGQGYVILMMAVVATALIMAALLALAPLDMRDFRGVPATEVAAMTARLRGISGLFLALALLTFTAGWNGVTAARTRTDPVRAGSRASATLAAVNAAAAGPMAWVGLRVGEPLLLVFAVVCLLTGAGGLWGRWRPGPANGWAAAHAANMIGTGIAAHTAFLAVGAVRLFPHLYSHAPALSLIPWLAPAMVGTIAIAVIKRHLRNGHIVPLHQSQGGVPPTVARRSAP